MRASVRIKTLSATSWPVSAWTARKTVLIPPAAERLDDAIAPDPLLGQAVARDSARGVDSSIAFARSLLRVESDAADVSELPIVTLRQGDARGDSNASVRTSTMRSPGRQTTREQCRHISRLSMRQG